MPFPYHIPLENRLYLLGTHMHELQLKYLIFSFISLKEEVSKGPIYFLLDLLSNIFLLDCLLEKVVPK